MLQAALSELDIPIAPLPDRPVSIAPPPPRLRHVSSSERGGWQLFGRLLIWATRNNRAARKGAPDPASRPPDPDPKG